MRTTITIDDGLLAQAKRLAADRGLTLSQFVERALRRATAEPRDRHEEPFDLITFGSGGLAPGYDWATLVGQTQEEDDLELIARMKEGK